jgi:hypothetical protein
MNTSYQYVQAKEVSLCYRKNITDTVTGQHPAKENRLLNVAWALCSSKKFMCFVQLIGKTCRSGFKTSDCAQFSTSSDSIPVQSTE